ncbi:MAG: biotin transporter BioY [Geminicoccaceae bacterium]|jgi:biotin transport system substrate-specific component|nr:biotin transporter BioY [Geminicoccaceae bacterium]MCB9968561.1 biotin transporter BioY [Geminicoccaceae bacterium]HRY23728.1 biotin transporter BioY [Geminicoccaceae bacterium]
MNPTLTTALWPSSAQSLPARIVLVLAGTLLLAVSARVQVPFWPVPMTMQTFVVLGIGAAYGARLAGITLLTYLAQGAMGLPVFATGAGLAYLAGPTGGYLVGFFVAAVVVGYLADEGLGRTHLSAFFVFLAATLLIFGLGATWLALLIGPAKAFAAGVLPFLPAEAAKLLLATAFFPIAWRLARD